ncbi:hypothetical protein M885DRAFT_622348, partial [Pelagophyceae sp. CCMP2097]
KFFTPKPQRRAEPNKERLKPQGPRFGGHGPARAGQGCPPGPHRHARHQAHQGRRGDTDRGGVVAPLVAPERERSRGPGAAGADVGRRLARARGRGRGAAGAAAAGRHRRAAAAVRRRRGQLPRPRAFDDARPPARCGSARRFAAASSQGRERWRGLRVRAPVPIKRPPEARAAQRQGRGPSNDERSAGGSVGRVPAPRHLHSASQAAAPRRCLLTVSGRRNLLCV